MSTNLDQQFEAIYRAHAQEITAHIVGRLFRTDRHLAEDLTAETFIGLWRNLANGITVEHPRALLRTIADRAVAAHFRRRSSTETATDFAAANFTEVPASATFSPHLASLWADLEQAKDNLSAAADAYRSATQENSTASLVLASSSRPDVVARAKARKASAVSAREAALEAFTVAGQAVAAARAAWNEGAHGLHGLTAAALTPGVVSSR